MNEERSAPSRVRVGGVAQAVAEEDERENHEDDGHHRQHEPGIERHEVDVLGLVQI
jgi:hypothetical protein